MPPRATNHFVHNQVQTRLVGVAPASHHARELPTMEVQIPGLLGGTLLHRRRPPNLVCGDALPDEEQQAEQPHRGGAGESFPTNRPKRVCAFGMHCGGPDIPEKAALWQFLGQCLAVLDPLQNGTEAPPQTFIMHGRESDVAFGST